MENFENSNLKNLKENVKVKNLSKGFTTKKALNNISLTLEPGKVYGLVGPNGSGKTTFFKILMNLYKKTNGSVQIMGKELSSKTREHISFMPAEDYIPLNMSPNKVIKFYKEMYKDFSEEKCRALLDNMKIPMNDSVKSFSTGMKMRLKIAVALGRECEIYLLDEPMIGIDIISRDLIKNSIISSNSESRSIVISSHLLGELENILDSVIFLKDGEKVLDGDLETLREEKGKDLDSIYREVYNA